MNDKPIARRYMPETLEEYAKRMIPKATNEFDILGYVSSTEEKKAISRTQKVGDKIWFKEE